MKKKKPHLILKTVLCLFAVYALFNFFSLRSQISAKRNEIDAMNEQIYEQQIITSNCVNPPELSLPRRKLLILHDRSWAMHCLANVFLLTLPANKLG